jgi:hypothetical protein
MPDDLKNAKSPKFSLVKRHLATPLHGALSRLLIKTQGEQSRDSKRKFAPICRVTFKLLVKHCIYSER